MSSEDFKTGRWKLKYMIHKRCACAKAGEQNPKCEECNGTGYVPVDPQATYFVLRLDEDPHARHAAITYARSVCKVNPLFAHDILRQAQPYLDQDEIGLWNNSLEAVEARMADLLANEQMIAHSLVAQVKDNARAFAQLRAINAQRLPDGAAELCQQSKAVASASVEPSVIPHASKVEPWNTDDGMVSMRLVCCIYCERDMAIPAKSIATLYHCPHCERVVDVS